MGLNRDIAVGGLFPGIPPTAELEPAAVFEHARLGNHPSFRERGQSSTPAGYDVVVEHLNAGFGRIPGAP